VRLYIGDIVPESYVMELADARAVTPSPGFIGISVDKPTMPPRRGSTPISFIPSAPMMNLLPKKSSAT
jgi:hypothetical protein